MRVRATDKDVGLNGTVTYNITSVVPSSGKFSIDTGTGSVTTKETIDYETDPHNYTLTVSYVQKETLQLTNTCTYVVD